MICSPKIYYSEPLKVKKVNFLEIKNFKNIKTKNAKLCHGKVRQESKTVALSG